MSSVEKNKHVYSAKKIADSKLRRRDLYKLVSADKKEALLLQRRTKRQEKKRGLSQPITSYDRIQLPDEDIEDNNALPKDFSSVSATAGGSYCHTLAFDKTEPITSPFHTFEVGSTSATPPVVSHQTCTVVSKKASEVGRKKGPTESDYVPLKVVPNCKLCGAKRFEYEPPGFCCGSGSIKLVTHEPI